MHVKAYQEKPTLYPQRAPLLESELDWKTSLPGYRPAYFVADIVLMEYANHGEKGWADPEDIRKLERHTQSFVTKLTFDDFGRPLNPMGRTGIYGRGLLGKWGPNFATDAFITRQSPKTQKIEGLFILRNDNRQWAIPGGMIDSNETSMQGAKRELKEETGLSLCFHDNEKIYSGYVDDPRNTDNAWIETTLYHKHISEDSIFDLRATDDALQAQFKEINEELIKHLYASHQLLVKKSLEKLSI